MTISLLRSVASAFAKTLARGLIHDVVLPARHRNATLPSEERVLVTAWEALPTATRKRVRPEYLLESPHQATILQRAAIPQRPNPSTSS